MNAHLWGGHSAYLWTAPLENMFGFYDICSPLPLPTHRMKGLILVVHSPWSLGFSWQIFTAMMYLEPPKSFKLVDRN